MLVRGIAWLAAVLTGAASVVWLLIILDGNDCWSAFAFTMMAGSVLAGTLLLGVVPNWLRYARTKQPRDWMALQVAGLSCLILLAAIASLWIIPQRGE